MTPLLAIFIAIFVMMLILTYFRNVRPRKKAFHRCLEVLYEFEYSSVKHNSDQFAPDKWEELIKMMQSFGIELDEIGINKAILEANKASAYISFLRYVSSWKEQHEKLEERILLARNSSPKEFIKEIELLGPAIAKSSETMRQLEEKWNKFTL